MKYSIIVLMFLAGMVFAATVTGINTFAPDYDGSFYAQYTHVEQPNGGSYKDVPGDAGHAYDAAITLDVKAGTKVWLTNYVSSWYGIDDLEAVFDMSNEKYGYIDDGGLHLSKGETTQVTYSKDGHSVFTKGYLLDYFGEDATIYIAMTPLNGEDIMVDTLQEMDSYLISRQDGNGFATLLDQADNVRINFGIADGKGYEFVAVSEEPVSQGQPLPGMLVCSLLCGGMLVARKKRV